MARRSCLRAHGLPANLATATLIIISLAAAPVRADLRVAVVDHFFPGEQAYHDPQQRQAALTAFDAADIDGDRRRDPFFHGDLVTLFLGDEGIRAVPYPVADPTRPKQCILEQLERIADDLAAGRQLDAVLLCWESSTLASAFGDRLVPGRKAECQAVIRDWAAQSETWALSLEIIAALEDLVDAGLTVVTIAGNSGSRMVNTYSFARGVVTVGDADPDPEGRWIGTNALVDTVAQAAFPVRLVCDAERPSFGYDLDGDGRADVPLERVSSYQRRKNAPPRESWRVLRGSSFAAPTALRDLVALQQP